MLDSETGRQILLSSNTLRNTYGFGRCISKIKDTSFINDIKGITSRIVCLNTVYLAYVVLKAISVCNLLHHNTGHTVYFITYNVRDMTFSSLSESA